MKRKQFPETEYNNQIMSASKEIMYERLASQGALGKVYATKDIMNQAFLRYMNTIAQRQYKYLRHLSLYGIIVRMANEIIGYKYGIIGEDIIGKLSLSGDIKKKRYREYSKRIMEAILDGENPEFALREAINSALPSGAVYLAVIDKLSEFDRSTDRWGLDKKTLEKVTERLSKLENILSKRGKLPDRYTDDQVDTISDKVISMVLGNKELVDLYHKKMTEESIDRIKGLADSLRTMRIYPNSYKNEKKEVGGIEELLDNPNTKLPVPVII